MSACIPPAMGRTESAPAATGSATVRVGAAAKTANSQGRMARRERESMAGAENLNGPEEIRQGRRVPVRPRGAGLHRQRDSEQLVRSVYSYTAT